MKHNTCILAGAFGALIGCQSPAQSHEGHEGHQEHEAHAAHAAEQEQAAHHGHAHHEHAHHGLELPKGEALSGSSVYQLESTWTDQDGASVQLRAFLGKPVVLAMVYTHCQHACPRIVADMGAIEAKLSETERAQTQFVLASIDPERDTVQRLAEFAKQAGLHPPAWRLLHGDADAVRDLAAVLGVKYRPEPPADFAHSNLVSVLDKGGLILHQQEGLGVAADEAVAAVHRLLGTPP